MAEGPHSAVLSMAALLSGLLILTAHIPTALGLCEYWGVDTGCNYDGRHERPTRCKGLGRRYCDRAPEVEECPDACRYEKCRKVQQDKFYFHENHPGFYWEDLVLANDYDMVFANPSKVCVQTCWKFPFLMKCGKERRYDGVKYCADIKCDHDPFNRFVGCHKDRPWHKPTCAECAHLFPNACKAEARSIGKRNPSDEYDRLLRMDLYSSDAVENIKEGSSDGDDFGNKYGSSDNEAASSAEDDGSSKTGLKQSSADQQSSDDASSQELRCNDSSDGYGTNCRVGRGPPIGDHMYLDLWAYGTGSQPNKSDTMEMVPIRDDPNGTDFMSFNELEYQVVGNSEDMDPDSISRAIAAIVGVDQVQVQTVQLFDEPRAVYYSDDGEKGNSTMAPGIVTVTTVIWTNDPFGLSEKMEEIVSSRALKEGIAINGVHGFLEGSMTTNIVSAPVERMVEVFPDAVLYVNQTSPSPSRRSRSSPNRFVIIGVSIGSAMLLCGVAAILALAYSLIKQAKENKAEMQCKDSMGTERAQPSAAAAAVGARKTHLGTPASAMATDASIAAVRSSAALQSADLSRSDSQEQPGSGRIGVGY